MVLAARIREGSASSPVAAYVTSIYLADVESISKSASADEANNFSTQTTTTTTTAERQIISYLNKATDSNCERLWDKLNLGSLPHPPSHPLGVPDLFALALIRQHCIFAERRPAKAILASSNTEDPGVRNATISAIQMCVFGHIIKHVQGFQAAMIKWMSVFLDLNGSDMYRFLTESKYSLCVMGAALDEGSVFGRLPMPLLYDVLTLAGSKANSYISPAAQEQMLADLNEHQHTKWQDPWHLNTFAAVLSQWIGSGVGCLLGWTVQVTLPCLLSRNQPKSTYAALLILLGVCKQLKSKTHVSEDLAQEITELGRRMLQSPFVYDCDTQHTAPIERWTQSSQTFRAEQLMRFLQAPPFNARDLDTGELQAALA